MNSVKTTQTQVVTGLLVFLALLSMKKWLYLHFMEPLWLSTCTTGMQPDHHHSKIKHVCSMLCGSPVRLVQNCMDNFTSSLWTGLASQSCSPWSSLPDWLHMARTTFVRRSGRLSAASISLGGPPKGTNYGRGQKKGARSPPIAAHTCCYIHRTFQHRLNIQQFKRLYRSCTMAEFDVLSARG